MPDRPLISVITPTFRRRAVLTGRCVPCVAAQTYPAVEHIIISDGPDSVLAATRFPDHVRYSELPEHDIARYGRWGTGARLAGIVLARGAYIAYLDDDDIYYEGHLERLADVLDDAPGAGFAYAAATFNGGVIGQVDPPQYAQVSTSTLMHRREILDLATWRDDGQETIDWDIVSRWMTAGVQWRMSPEVTVDLGVKGGTGYEDGIAYQIDGRYA